MGRELKRKEAKKNNVEIKKEIKKEPENEVIKLIKIFIYITIGLVFLYFIVGIFITKEIKVDWFDTKEKNTEVTMNADYILCSEIFKQKEESYYVYFYKFKETNSSIDTLLSGKLSKSRVYKVDIESDFNSSYIGTINNANNIDEFRVNGLTLIKVENNNISSFIAGESEIITYLNELDN